MHYAEVEKLGLKWLTLTTRFSEHFCTEGAKYLTRMSKLPKNLKKKMIEEDVRQKKGKKSVAHVCQGQPWCQQFVSPNGKIIVLCIFFANISKWQKNAFKV